MSSSASISRSIFPLTDDLDRACFGRDRNSRDQVGMIDDTTRAIFGRSYAAEPDVLVKQLREDEAIEAADTLLLTIPNQLGVDHNVHVMESILTHLSRHAPTRQVEVLATVSGPEELKTRLMQHAEASAAQRASGPPDAYRALLGMATRAAPGLDRRREDLHRSARP